MKHLVSVYDSMGTFLLSITFKVKIVFSENDEPNILGKEKLYKNVFSLLKSIFFISVINPI